MGDVKCMHCGIVSDSSTHSDLIKTGMSSVLKDVDGFWAIQYSACPVCKKNTIYLLNVTAEGPLVRSGKVHFRISQVIKEILVHPLGRVRQISIEEVPDDIAQDYKEACSVLPFSAKASAALSRRCLQNLLRDVAGVKPSDLSREIQDVIDSGKLPTHLVDSIDAIRNIGNFAAHPMKSKSTGEIVDIEPEEAEWNLDVLESLFDFYYVQPAKIASKRNALNAKLLETGKPPMK